MKFFENTMSAISLICTSIAIYQIIKTQDFSPMNMFILGVGAALVAAVVKSMNDSRARDHYDLLNGKKS